MFNGINFRRCYSLLLSILEMFIGEVPLEYEYLTIIFGYQLGIILILSFLKFFFGFANIISTNNN